MSTNTTNKRKRITIDTKVAIINAVDKQERSNAQICRDFGNKIILSTFFFIPYYGNNDNLCYKDTLRKERELLLLPSSTVELVMYNKLLNIVS